LIPLTAAGCGVQGYEDVVVRMSSSARQCAVPEGEIYSPSQHTTYVASLPPATVANSAQDQEPDPGVLLWGADEPEPKVAELLRVRGTDLDGQVSNPADQDQAAFHTEKDAVYQAGLPVARAASR